MIIFIVGYFLFTYMSFFFIKDTLEIDCKIYKSETSSYKEELIQSYLDEEDEEKSEQILTQIMRPQPLPPIDFLQ